MPELSDDRAPISDDLRRVDALIAAGARRITEQRVRIERVRGSRISVVQSEYTLAVLEETQALYITDRGRLVAELRKLEAR